MKPSDRTRANTRTHSERRLTWMTAGVAAIGLVSTGGFAVAAAATYAGEPKTAQLNADGTRPEDGTVSGQTTVTDPAAAAAPLDPGPQLFTTPTRKKHATSGGSH